jgi:Tfp pilus assembly ATPase PilU
MDFSLPRGELMEIKPTIINCDDLGMQSKSSECFQAVTKPNAGA